MEDKILFQMWFWSMQWLLFPSLFLTLQVPHIMPPGFTKQFLLSGWETLIGKSEVLGHLASLQAAGNFWSQRQIPGDPDKMASLVAQLVKKSTCNVGDLGSIPRLWRSSEGGHGNPLQNSCLENPHGQRSLEGYSQRCYKELDSTKRLSITTWGIVQDNMQVFLL